MGKEFEEIKQTLVEYKQKGNFIIDILESGDFISVTVREKSKLVSCFNHVCLNFSKEQINELKALQKSKTL